MVEFRWRLTVFTFGNHAKQSGVDVHWSWSHRGVDQGGEGGESRSHFSPPPSLPLISRSVLRSLPFPFPCICYWRIFAHFLPLILLFLSRFNSDCIECSVGIVIQFWNVPLSQFVPRPHSVRSRPSSSLPFLYLVWSRARLGRHLVYDPFCCCQSLARSILLRPGILWHVSSHGAVLKQWNTCFFPYLSLSSHVSHCSVASVALFSRIFHHSFHHFDVWNASAPILASFELFVTSLALLLL